MRLPAKVWLSLRGESDAAQAPCSELEKEVKRIVRKFYHARGRMYEVLMMGDSVVFIDSYETPAEIAA